MGQQRIVGAFPGSPFQASLVNFGLGVQNLIDGFAEVPFSTWTPGDTVITPVKVEPPLAATWSILGWTISFKGVLNYPAAGSGQSFGLLGKVIGGLSSSSPTAGTYIGAPATDTGVALPLPNDGLTSLATLWDGATDPPFVSGTTAPPTMMVPRVITGGADLNQPIQISSGDTLSIGLWLEPSLIYNVAIQIGDASYVVFYDDGLPPAAGWGTGQ